MQPLKKIYLEITTRCNLRCDKCIKQIENNKIVEGDMPLEVFEKIVPQLPQCNQLILNGIGEPLLHPDLETMIKSAREFMSVDADIGFQTNGMLMTQERGESLLTAGISTVCLSLDSLVNLNTANSCSAIPAVERVSEALGNLRRAMHNTQKKIQLGLEIVVSKENIDQLPDMITWAKHHEVDYILVSHLFAYSQEMLETTLFSTSSTEALAIFLKYQTRALEMGIDLSTGLKAYQKYLKTPSELKAQEILQEMREEAASKDAWLHWKNLFNYDPALAQKTQSVFSRSANLAKLYGVELYLPPLEAPSRRKCTFMEEKAAFISFQGEVMPCHFLWHSYPCMAANEVITVQQRSYGNITDASLDDIWKNNDYETFRDEAAMAEFSHCWSCPQGPCEDLVNNELIDAHDCYGSKVPCGHCLWSLGGLRCL